MQTQRSYSFLRRVLMLDALASGAMGAGLLLLAPVAASLLELPEALLRETGIVLIPFAAFVGYLASRAQPPRFGVWAVIVVNAIWTIDSIALLFTDWVAPNAFGCAIVIGQAVVVGVFAELEYLGLRKGAVAMA
jgi:hypothetical protein